MTKITWNERIEHEVALKDINIGEFFVFTHDPNTVFFKCRTRYVNISNGISYDGTSEVAYEQVYPLDVELNCRIREGYGI